MSEASSAHTQQWLDLGIPGVAEVDTARHITIYSAPSRSTVPSEVAHDTPLESLNLNWRERDLPERIRTKHVHRLHPYLGKFIPQLVEIFLRKYFAPGQTVLDPFCGSGTTLVQANELGINSVGYDISAFNVLLASAKLATYDVPTVTREIMEVLRRTREATAKRTRPSLLFDELASELHIEEPVSAYLKTWFAPQALTELLAYRHFIDAGDCAYPDLLKVILSRSARSARLTTHFDLDFPKRPQTEAYWCYKHSRMCEPTSGAMKFLERYSLDTAHRVAQFARLRTEASRVVCHGDSRCAPIPPVDGVVTSPPYVGLIDYHEQHAYAYHLLGLEDRRELEIGAACNGASVKAKAAYQDSIAEVFRNAVASMPSGGRLIVVAGDRANLYGRIAELVDVDVEAVVKRQVNRRTGRRSSDFFESVFVWRKR